MRFNPTIVPALVLLLLAGSTALTVQSAAFAQDKSSSESGQTTLPADASATDKSEPGSGQVEEGGSTSEVEAVYETAPDGRRILPSPTEGLALPLMDTSIDATKRAYGAYQRGFYLTAMDLALSRAQLGDPAAQTLVGELFSEGLGIPRNLKEAAFWYGQAAQGGDSSAQFKYAIMLLEGKYVERDAAKAREIMGKAADAGNAFAQFNHAQALLARHPGDVGVRQALPYFEKAANKGVADAQYALAQIYMNSLGIEAEKRAEARKWMRIAARNNYDTAQLDLAIWLIDGKGGDKDYEEGFRWMEIAANRGNVVAQNRLGILYVNAIGTRPDPVEAAKWHILSKRAGYNDPELDDFYQGLTEDEQKQALDRANKFTRR